MNRSIFQNWLNLRKFKKNLAILVKFGKLVYVKVLFQNSQTHSYQNQA